MMVNGFKFYLCLNFLFFFFINENRIFKDDKSFCIEELFLVFVGFKNVYY